MYMLTNLEVCFCVLQDHVIEGDPPPAGPGPVPAPNVALAAPAPPPAPGAGLAAAHQAMLHVRPLSLDLFIFLPYVIAVS